VTRARQRIWFYVSVAVIIVVFLLTVRPYSSFVLEKSGSIFFVSVLLLSALPSVAIGATILLWKVLEPKEHGEVGAEQLRNLKQAQESLSESLSFLKQLEVEVESQQKAHRNLEELVASLEVTSKERSEDLRQKLKAIEYVNREREYWKIVVAFGLGVISSLVASLIWALFS